MALSTCWGRHLCPPLLPAGAATSLGGGFAQQEERPQCDSLHGLQGPVPWPPNVPFRMPGRWAAVGSPVRQSPHLPISPDGIGQLVAGGAASRMRCEPGVLAAILSLQREQLRWAVCWAGWVFLRFHLFLLKVDLLERVEGRGSSPVGAGEQVTCCCFWAVSRELGSWTSQDALQRPSGVPELQVGVLPAATTPAHVLIFKNANIAGFD